MKTILCFFLGHKYKVTKKITSSIYELSCKRCAKQFGMNTSVKSLLPLDSELKQLHSELLK